MYFLETSAAFDAAHFLAGYEGKCANIHGHHWVVEVKIGGRELSQSGEKRGMLIDFGDLKNLVRGLAEKFDHTLLYERGSLREKTLEALSEEGFRLAELSYRPTAENLARDFYERLRADGLPVLRVTVYETPDNCAAYSEVEL